MTGRTGCQVGVTFISTEHFDMGGMREGGTTGIFILVEDIADVTGRTVTADGINLQMGVVTELHLARQSLSGDMPCP